MNILLLFIILNVANVIIQTVKSIATIKCGKTVAALVNAVAYGLYTFVVVYMTVDDLSIWTRAGIIALANLVGVWVVKYFEERNRKDKLWKIEMAVPIKKADTAMMLIADNHISSNANIMGEWVMFNCYCKTQDESRKMTEIAKAVGAKMSAYESKNLLGA